MLTHRKLKIWTIILHGLILIGAGHGIAPFFLLEIVGFLNAKETNTSFSFLPEENHFFAVGLTAILGKIVIIISLFIVQKNRKLLFHISGLCLLWLSVIYFGYDAANDSYVHIAWVTVVPFFICTILTFTGKYLKKAYHWLGENL